MILRTNQTGQFLECEGYFDEGDLKCKKTYSLIPEELFTDNDDKEAETFFNNPKCDICGSTMDVSSSMKIENCIFAPSSMDMSRHKIRRR